VLITAIFTSPSTLNLIRELREEGIVEQVFFDSGGFFVQMGRISYEDMYWQLLQFYRANDWGDWYTLPDYVPLSSDDEETCWYKTRRTADGSRLFYQEMPDDCKGKSLAVVQGRTTEQVDYCLESHLSLGIGRLGFGSFGTNGKQSNSNIVTAEALSLLKYVTGIASDDGIELHAFGVGTPPVIYLLNESGVASFDSIGWMKTAGFGKVYLPFMRAYNITYRDKSARGMTQDVFEELKIRSGHECAFCANFDDLAAKRNYRILHNLAAIQDTVDLIHTQPTSKKLLQMMADYSPTYSRLRSVAES
jgi:queuine/archaeosine tRNA-ribosyltransferase